MKEYKIYFAIVKNSLFSEQREDSVTIVEAKNYKAAEKEFALIAEKIGAAIGDETDIIIKDILLS
jgi:hypothetical protein